MEERENKQDRLSYEELENIANQLSNQNEALLQQLQQVMMNNTFKRIDYLFKVIENPGAFNTEFVVKTSEELESLLTIPEDIEEVNTESIEEDEYRE